MTRVRTIALVDHTRRHRPPDGALEAIAEALTIQIERDFCPAWHREPVRVTVGGRGDKIHFFDTSHDAIDYGWHYVDGDGLPYAHVFVEPSIKNGSDWVSGRDAISISAGHEVLELLGDPAANSYCFDGRDRLWAHEICDAVQERSYRITAGGMRVHARVSKRVLTLRDPYVNLLRNTVACFAAGIGGVEAAETERGQQPARTDVDDGALPVPRQGRGGQRNGEDLVGPHGGVGTGRPVDHVVAA